MLIQMLGQLNAIAQRNDAVFAGMRAHQAQLGLIRDMNAPTSDRVDFSNLARLHNKDKRLAFAGIKNEFIAKAMDSWYNSLAEKNKKS